MAIRHSQQLVEILRTSLHNIENDPSTESTNEDLVQLKRILLRWIAEAETAENRALASPVEKMPEVKHASVPPAKKAIELAVALISTSDTPKAAETEADH